FEFVEKSSKAPIVVYGTSIVQGACASRPAMAWTTILQQAIDMPLVNLGFSGNGLLEKELIDWISAKESSLIILDCLPNLVPGKGIADDEIRARIQYAARKLRSDNSKVPVLFTAHAGYSDQYVDHSRRELVTKLNTILLEELDKLWKQGVNGIHHLSSEAIGLDQFDFVDGTHPTDGGMLKYAKAYQNKILEVYKEERK
ncbi:MAG: hydrolase, partial [Cyclobacteriaceae bacterium]|nr:hydrolase [Cyclobacteriaceae bacterium]